MTKDLKKKTKDKLRNQKKLDVKNYRVFSKTKKRWIQSILYHSEQKFVWLQLAGSLSLIFFNNEKEKKIEKKRKYPKYIAITLHIYKIINKNYYYHLFK